MAFDKGGLDDYVDVTQRIADFRKRHPEGSLQPADPANPFEVRQVEGVDKHGKEFKATFIVYRAAAYRTQDDQRPGIGMAWEVFPGRTPYTLGSELMNAETSAWGRAIVAVLASDSKRGVSSREEVRNRSAEQDESWRDQPMVTRQGNGAKPAEAAEPQWETPPAGSGNGSSGPSSGQSDEQAQEIAVRAHGARTASEMSKLNQEAFDAGKLNTQITDPGNGVKGRLGAYLKHRRQQVEAEHKALAELTTAGKRAGLDGDALDARVQELTGACIEDATVAQMKEAAAKLADQAGARA